MKLKPNIDLIEFFKAVQKCPGNVLYCTDEGDRLDLKSVLSQYLLTAVSMKPDILEMGQIVCDRPEGEAVLAGFVK